MTIKHKPLNKFEQGYLAALSTIIGYHGLSTEVYEAFNDLGVPLERVLAWEHLNEFDRENLQHLQSM